MLNRAIAKHVGGMTQQQKFFQFSYPELLRLFKVVGKKIGLELSPHQIRHSGASIDGYIGHRGLPTIQRLGRWVAWKSVQRYEKGGLLAKASHQLSVAQRSYFATCQRSLEGILCCLEGPRVPVRAALACMGRK
eukprot:5956616-Amphidinium_carterae.1